jgi:manganese/iron transport system permease protein/iron/zinc/copper transport system permease protein
MLSDRFRTVLLLSTGLGAACGFVGIYLSFFIDVSSGAAVVLVEAGVFALVMAYTNLRPRRVPSPMQNVHPVSVGQPSPGEPD